MIGEEKAMFEVINPRAFGNPIFRQFSRIAPKLCTVKKIKD
jgi:hypothetical protein